MPAESRNSAEDLCVFAFGRPVLRHLAKLKVLFLILSRALRFRIAVASAHAPLITRSASGVDEMDLREGPIEAEVGTMPGRASLNPQARRPDCQGITELVHRFARAVFLMINRLMSPSTGAEPTYYQPLRKNSYKLSSHISPLDVHEHRIDIDFPPIDFNKRYFLPAVFSMRQKQKQRHPKRNGGSTMHPVERLLLDGEPRSKVVIGLIHHRLDRSRIA